MSNKKSPFKAFTVDEVLKVESNSYVIQIGQDFYSFDGDFVFSIAEVKKHYNKILTNILDTIDNGTVRQKNAALNCLSRFHVLPLRIQ